MEPIINLLDETVAVIKSKSPGTLYPGQAKFEFYIFICLDVVRFELITSNKITDTTAKAILQLFVFQEFEYYYRDYPEVYSKSKELFNALTIFNKKLAKDELGALGVKDEDWINYIKQSFTQLIRDNKPNNI